MIGKMRQYLIDNAYGDGKTLEVVLFRLPNEKRYQIYVLAHGDIVEKKSFNKLSVAKKYFKKIYDEF